MKTPNLFKLWAVVFFLLTTSALFSQSTSWTGAVSTAWGTATNWTNGVPTSALDAVVGDAAFTGINQPAINVTATCKSLSLGGAVATTLTATKNLSVASFITINNNGTMVHPASSISLTGNWTNNGTYTANSTTSAVIFSGTVQSLNGTSISNFRKLTLNAGSVLTLNTNLTCTGVSALLSVSGTLNPNEAPGYTVTTDNLTVNNGGYLKVNAATFSANYIINTAFVLSSGSVVDYSSTTTNQVISSDYVYSTLRILGSGTKSLLADLPALRSTSAAVGNIYVVSGILDLGIFIANRGTTTAGGTITVANGSTLRIRGTNTFPANYTSATLNLTSTVEYGGGDQAVAAKTYGNLLLSGSTGSVAKTFPATAMTIAGSLTSDVKTATALAFTAAANLTVTGSVAIGASTTFNAATFTHAVSGNWVMNGVFVPGTSTINLKGVNAVVSGQSAQSFFNLSITGSNTTAPAVSDLTISGNLVTSGSGTFIHAAPNNIYLTGTTKAITGTGITLNNLSVSGVVTTASNFILTGNLAVTNSFIASSGVVTMNGSGKTITNSGTLTLRGLLVPGSVTTASSFNIAASISCSGSFTASAGTVSFTASSLLSGSVNLFNAAIAAGTLSLAANSTMGIASVFTTTGTFNVTSYIPNTVNYNGPSTQTVKNTIYNNLQLSNGGSKTAAGAITVNNTLSISPAVTFDPSTFTHTIIGNWVNNGTFTAGTSTIAFTGGANSSITGATTFNILTVNKSLATYIVSLASNISVATVNMTAGMMSTGASSITITTTRSGPGIILGTITRTHTFAIGSYAFEGASNTITFTAVTGVNSVTINVGVAPVADFPYNGAIGRTYTISIPSGTYTASLKLHYEDAELNGNDESLMQLWKYNVGSWAASGKTTNSTTANWVEKTALTNIAGRWTITDDGSVLNWNGSVSSDWATAGNWTLVQGTFSGAPTSTDIAQIGVAGFTNQPVITTAAVAKSITLGSAQPVNITLNTGGSITSNGSISGNWTAAASHTINLNAQTITLNGDLTLGDNIAGHDISLNVSTGILNVAGSLTQTGNSSIVFTGAGALNLGKDYNYSGGTFTASTSTVKYNGGAAQVIAAIPYYNLNVAKSTGTLGTFNGNAAISGALTVTTGILDVSGNLSVAGTVTIMTTSTLNANASTISVGVGWSKSATGTFNPGAGTVIFNGTVNQAISAGAFNKLVINKTGGVASLSGNNTVNGDLSLVAGSLNLSTFTLNQSSAGDVFSMADGSTLLLGGASNFPTGFSDYQIGSNSLVHYNGTVAQSVADLVYGNISFSNGGTNAKTLMGAGTINGNLVINSAVNLNAANFPVTLLGNWTNNGGTFIPGTGDLILNGTGKTLSGNTTFNDFTVNGSYAVTSSDMTFNGHFQVTAGGSYQAGTGTATTIGDFTNAGSVQSSGTVTFAGTALQTIRLVNALQSTSTGIVNFNGSVAPVLNSTSVPTFATLNINNTAGITPSVNWMALVACNISSSSAFNGGVYTHTFSGNFANNGVVTSAGTLIFNPSAAATVQLSGTTFSSMGTVILGGSGLMTITGAPTSLQDLVIANTNAAGLTTPSGWTINGKFSINNNAIFNPGPYIYNVGGNIEADGQLIGGSSTFNLTANPGTLSAGPGAVFNHFTVTGNISPLTDFRVAGDFTNNGTYDGSAGVLIMTGANAATISGTTSPCAIDQLTIEKASGTIVTQNVNLSGLSFLNVFSGILFTSTRTITQDPGGGILIVNDGATLRLGGTNSLPGFSGYGLTVNSTVDYAGTSQAIGNAADYGNLVISTAGTKSGLIPFVVRGNLSVLGGLLATATMTVTHTVQGNFIMTGGSLTGTTSTYLLNGNADQSVSLLSNLVNLTVNKPSGMVILGSNTTVNQSLNLTRGKIRLDNYDLSIAPGGSIINAGNLSYAIASSTGNLVQQVPNGTAKNFPVGSLNNYLPAVLTLTPGSVTDNFRIRVFDGIYEKGLTGGRILSNAVDNSWLVSEDVAGGSTATLALQWPASLELPGFTRASSRLGRHDGVYWELGPSDIVASGSDPFSVARGGFNDFSVFGVGMFIVLPVTWLEVYGEQQADGNKIYWGTASETNNSSFVIEASQNGSVFRSIGKLQGSINSSVESHYNFLHKNPAQGRWYYRIKQIDIDGRASYSRVVIIEGNRLAFSIGRLYPVPAGDNFTMEINSNVPCSVRVLLTNSAGQVVSTSSKMLTAGSNQVLVDLHGQAAGVYYIRIEKEDGKSQLVRIVKY